MQNNRIAKASRNCTASNQTPFACKLRIAARIVLPCAETRAGGRSDGAIAKLAAALEKPFAAKRLFATNFAAAKHVKKNPQRSYIDSRR